MDEFIAKFDLYNALDFSRMLKSILLRLCIIIWRLLSNGNFLFLVSVTFTLLVIYYSRKLGKTAAKSDVDATNPIPSHAIYPNKLIQEWLSTHNINLFSLTQSYITELNYSISSQQIEFTPLNFDCSLRLANSTPISLRKTNIVVFGFTPLSASISALLKQAIETTEFNWPLTVKKLEILDVLENRDPPLSNYIDSVLEKSENVDESTQTLANTNPDAISTISIGESITDREVPTDALFNAQSSSDHQELSNSLPDLPPDNPVVLPYNDTIRHSIYETPPVKRHNAHLVRSASEYVEEDEELLDTVLEEPTIGDLVMPSSQLPESFVSDASEELSSGQKFPSSSLECTGVVDNATTSVWDNRRSFSVRKLATSASVAHDAQDYGGLRCTKLLVKVLKAEDLLLKATSNAYCVAELDEPFQRHATPCSSPGQLFWDQHLLFHLNTNSKRFALEVFELSKKKRSVSKGRAELLLSSLLWSRPMSADQDCGDCSTSSHHNNLLTGSFNRSEICRRLKLLNRHSSESAVIGSGSTTLTAVGESGVGGGSEGQQSSSSPTTGTTGSIPVVIAEFHFMERLHEESLLSRHRPSAGQLFAVTSRLPQSSSSQPQSSSATDSPILGSPVSGLAALSHSTSLDMTQQHRSQLMAMTSSSAKPLSSKLAVADTVESIAEQQLHQSGDDKPDSHSIKASSTVQMLRSAQLLSPIPIRRAHLLINSPPLTPSSTASSDHHPPSPSSLLVQHPKTDTSQQIFFGCSSSTSAHDYDLGADPLQRKDSLLKRSHLIGPDESSPVQHLLPYPDTGFDSTNNGSNNSDQLRSSSSNNQPAAPNTSRSHSLVGRLRSSSKFLLHSGQANKQHRSTLPSSTSLQPHGGSLALLGPSRHLAGVVAGLSSIATASSTSSINSPSSAAALASAVAVAGATGSWQQQGKAANAPTDVVASTSDDAVVRCESRSSSNAGGASFGDIPVRYVPPAASIAAEIPGTYTAFSQPRRSETSNISLLRMFRTKKKRFRSAGAEKLLYFDHDDVSSQDFDTISTEGYNRLVRDDADADESD